MNVVKPEEIEIPMNHKGRRRLEKAIKANVKPSLDKEKAYNIFKLL